MSQALLEYDSAIPQKLCEDVVLSSFSQTCQSITGFAISKNYHNFLPKGLQPLCLFHHMPFHPKQRSGKIPERLSFWNIP